MEEAVVGGAGLANAAGQLAISRLAPPPPSVWLLDPFERGVQLENWAGRNLPQNFPDIDRFENGVATSIKSLNLAADTYQKIAPLSNVIKQYIDDVAQFNGAKFGGVIIRSSEIAGRALELIVPERALRWQQVILDGMVDYGKTKDVTVSIISH
jgi:filamentous hemagglutinin